MKNRSLIYLVIITALLLAACGGQDTESAIATGIAQTQQISELQTAAAGGNATATSPALVGDTATATLELTATSSIPYVSVSVDTNCRSGPRIDYKNITTVTVGQQVEVVMRSAYADYVVVRNPNGSGFCWLWLRYANTDDFSAYNLPQATQPATSTPTYTPSPTYTPTSTYTPSPTP
jgi:uncharacterized protein YgiM (DUF1202 family)